MSQKTTEKTNTAEKTEKTVKTAKTTAQKDGVVSSRDENSTREKIVWTLERCQRYARRYSSEILWASDAPASYKSAVAHGWLAECLTAMTTAQKGKKVTSGNFGKSTTPTGPNKKAA
jgi:hypothetical protein